MKNCMRCNAALADEAVFCTACGAKVDEDAAPGGAPYYKTVYKNPADHTDEFDAKDISDNKVMAMLVYLLGWIGIFAALLAASGSPYASFHVRQALKITVVNTLLGILALVFFWTVLIPIAAGICFVILYVVRIICFFQICAGKAKEPAIISSLGFLK